MDYDLVVKGGEVVSASGRARLDVGIAGERIGALGHDLAGRATIDAAGLWVLPGVIDAHTHFALPVSGMRTADDFASGTRAAALGGVTTVIDFTTAIDSPLAARPPARRGAPRRGRSRRLRRLWPARGLPRLGRGDRRADAGARAGGRDGA